MPDRTKNDQTSNGMQCSEFELLLADAIDGAVGKTELGRFQAHAASCKACGPLLADAEAGRSWLKGLTEVEPPANLVTAILASTTGVDTQRLRVNARVNQPQVSWLERMQASLFGYLEPIWTTVRQPRFAMSFGMAFFALSVGLTVAGVKPADLANISLRPTSIKRTYSHTQARVVHYYENIRIVYEVESLARQVKRNVAPAEPGPAKQKDHKNDTTQQPDQPQERNYSQGDNQLILASAPSIAPLGPCLDSCDLPVVPVTTYRRFV
jgi:Putative zinc-finger